MSLEQNIADLVTATTSLTEAVNVKKQQLDEAVIDAQTAADSVQIKEQEREQIFEDAQEERENEFSASQIDKQNRFNDFIASSGYQFLGDYAAGIEITEYNQIVRDSDGEFWRLSGQVELPYTTTGAGLPEDDALIPAGDAVLRQELASNLGFSMIGGMPFVTPEEFGAVGDGVTDDSAAIISATQASDCVVFLGKNYIAEGLPIRTGLFYIGLSGEAKISLPATPSDHMFKTSGDSDWITSGGIRNIKLYGGGTTEYDGLNFSSIYSKRLEFWVADSVWITGFNYGFRGTNNDRMPVFINCRFESNIVGAIGGEHPLFMGCDFRSNDIGLTGRLNDFKMTDCKFAYNRIGVVPSSGTDITESSFVGCGFFKNTEIGLSVGRAVSVESCRISGDGPGSVGLVLATGIRNRVINNTFGQGVGTTQADIYIHKPAGSTVGSPGTIISGNTFNNPLIAAIKSEPTVVDWIIDGNYFVGDSPAMTFTQSLNGSIVSNNVALLSSENSYFLSVGANQLSTKISGNNIRYDGPGLPIIKLGTSDALKGCTIIGNSFESPVGQGRVVIKGSLSSAVLANNNLSDDSSMEISSTNGKTKIYGNVGYANSQVGTFIVPIGDDTHDVPFDVDVPITPTHITLSPLNRGASETRIFVSSVNNVDKYFTVRLSEASDTACEFSYRMERFT